MAVFRTVAASTSESALPGTTKPPGFKGVGPRSGGPLTWDWYAVFVDSEGKAMQGGSVTVQWYAVEVGAGGSYLTPTNGAQVTTDALVIARKSFGAEMWPWCTVTTATPPSVVAKKIDITIGSAADGLYTLDVEGYESNPVATYTASGDSLNDIRDGLIGSFSHPDLTAAARSEGVFRVEALEGGLDFELVLVSPEDDMTQMVAEPTSPAAVKLEIRTTPSAAAEIDATAITDAIAAIDFKAEAAEAITDACAAGGSIRNTVRPDGGGTTVTLEGGPDAGGGAAYYEVIPAQLGKITLQHFTIQSDKPIRYSIWSAAALTLYGASDLAESFQVDVGQPPAQWTAGPGGFRSIKSNLNEAMVLRISDRTAAVTFSYFAFVTDDN